VGTVKADMVPRQREEGMVPREEGEEGMDPWETVALVFVVVEELSLPKILIKNLRDIQGVLLPLRVADLHLEPILSQYIPCLLYLPAEKSLGIHRLWSWFSAVDIDRSGAITVRELGVSCVVFD